MLVIDDDAIVRQVACDMIEALGYRVVSAGSGREGLAVFARYSREIALVMLDDAMPRMSGVEVLQEIRRQEPTARILLASGWSEHEAGRRFAGLAIDGYLEKPFRLENLEAKLSAVLAEPPAGA